MTVQNRLLQALPEIARGLLLQEQQTVPLPRRTVLFEPDTKPTYGYFLISGMASFITNMEDGFSTEVSVAGNEGLIGGLHLLGPGHVPTACIMQLDGTGVRITLTRLQVLFDTNASIRKCILASVQEQANLVSQIAGCNRLHLAEERLARWLLMTQDRTGLDVLHFTQEFIAELLGARRTTVTAVAGALQRNGLIEYHRGSVRIVNRAALEKNACSCYRVTRTLRDSLYQ